MKKIFLILAIILFSKISYANSSITGTWTTIDDETNEPKSIVEIYEYQNKIYGRVVHLFKNPETKANNVKGSPKILGLDILWNLEKSDNNKYLNGKILDPKKGKIYNAEVWRDGKDLIVRGKIAFLGRNQTWKKSEKEPLKEIIPTIPELD